MTAAGPAAAKSRMRRNTSAGVLLGTGLAIRS